MKKLFFMLALLVANMQSIFAGENLPLRAWPDHVLVELIQKCETIKREAPIVVGKHYKGQEANSRKLSLEEEKWQVASAIEWMLNEDRQQQMKEEMICNLAIQQARSILEERRQQREMTVAALENLSREELAAQVQRSRRAVAQDTQELTRILHEDARELEALD